MSERASHQAILVWPFPSLPESVIKSYQNNATTGQISYSLKNYSKLAENTPACLIFNQLRKQILGLDTIVTE